MSVADTPKPPLNGTRYPDPSILTTALLYREIENVTSARHRELDALKEVIATRLDGMDRAADLKERESKLVAASIQSAVTHLLELHSERFSSVQTQFTERDVRVEETARQTKTAVDEALQAAEKAVEKQNQSFVLSIDKSEAATAKQIDTLVTSVQAGLEGLESKISDMKDRLQALESSALGRSSQIIDSRAQGGDMRAVVGLGITIMLAALTVIGFMVAMQ